jgi:hypothetical protein
MTGKALNGQWNVTVHRIKNEKEDCMRKAKVLLFIGVFLFCLQGMAAATPGVNIQIGDQSWYQELTEMKGGMLKYSNPAGFKSSAGSITGFSLMVDADPFIVWGFTATNFTNIPQNFGFAFLPGVVLNPAVPGNSIIDASISGGITDNDGNGVSIAPFGQATIQVNVTDFDTAKQFTWGVGPADFKVGPVAQALPYVGEFMATLPGPVAPVMFGDSVFFTLSANDTASLTGYCAVNATPIPGSLVLLGSGIFGLVGVGMRKKSSR